MCCVCDSEYSPSEILASASEFVHCAEILPVQLIEGDWSTYGYIHMQLKWSFANQM